MATTKLSIINGALAIVANDRLASVPPDEDINTAQVSNGARWALSLYDAAYEAGLSIWPWNDARRRHVLTAHGEAPAFGHSRQYELRPESLKAVAVRALGNPWEREGRFILHSGGETINVITIDKVAPDQLNAVTARVISAQLAKDIVIGVSESAAKQERAEKIYELRLKEALAADNWEGSSEQLLQSGWLLAAHTAYAPERDGWGDGSAGWLDAAGLSS